MNKPWPRVALAELLVQDTNYIDAPEPRVYPKLSVKLYGKGVVLDAPTDGVLLKMKRHQLARPGQVILSEIWGKKGAIGLVPPDGAGALCTSHFFLFDVRNERLDAGWLQAVFSANYLQDQLGADARGTTGYAAVRPKTLLACEIPLPPLAEQRRIAARIQVIAAQVAEAKELRLIAAHATQTLEDLRSRAVLQGVEHAESVPLEEVCSTITDCLHSNPIFSADGVPTVRSPDVGWGTIRLSAARRTSEEEYRRRTVRSKPEQGDIVLVREGGGTGKAGIVQEGQRFSLGQRVMLIKPDRQRVLPQFFLRQWLSPLIQEDQIAPRMKGSASPHLNISAIRRFGFLLPSIAAQQVVLSYLDKLTTLTRPVEALQEQVGADLDALLLSILHKAFSGEF